jgi:hypothetical protein
MQSFLSNDSGDKISIVSKKNFTNFKKSKSLDKMNN